VGGWATWATIPFGNGSEAQCPIFSRKTSGCPSARARIAGGCCPLLWLGKDGGLALYVRMYVRSGYLDISHLQSTVCDTFSLPKSAKSAKSVCTLCIVLAPATSHPTSLHIHPSLSLLTTLAPHPRHARKHARTYTPSPGHPAFPVQPRLRALVANAFIPHAHGG